MSGITKRLLTATLFAAFLMALPRVGTAKSQTQFSRLEPEFVVARVNDLEITAGDLRTAANDLLPAVTYHGSVSPERMARIRAKALERLIEEELLFNSPKRKQIKVKASEINDRIKILKKSLPRGLTLKEVLKRSNMTMKDLKRNTRRGIVIRRLKEKVEKDLKKKAGSLITDAYMKEYYEKNLDKFMLPDSILLSGILIKSDPSGGSRGWGKSLKEARRITELARGGEDFAELARKFSGSPSAAKGGNMGWGHRGAFIEEIGAATQDMKVGDIHDPVRTLYGYYILKLMDIKPSVQKEYEKLNLGRLRSELQKKEYKRLSDGWRAGLRKNVKIEYLVDLR